MKLSTPSTVLANPIKDIGYIYDLSCQPSAQRHSDFWEQGCNNHPTKAGYKV